jgi:hypothetical protein
MILQAISFLPDCGLESVIAQADLKVTEGNWVPAL